jgi:hypothetical protein
MCHHEKYGEMLPKADPLSSSMFFLSVQVHWQFLSLILNQWFLLMEVSQDCWRHGK